MHVRMVFIIIIMVLLKVSFLYVQKKHIHKIEKGDIVEPMVDAAHDFFSVQHTALLEWST